MDKVIKFLEQYVQWFTLGFAALFVAWAAYAYLYVPPLHVVVGTPPVDATPGMVDQVIKDGIVEKLNKAMSDPKFEAPKVADVLAQYSKGIDERTVIVTNWNAGTTSTYEGLAGAETAPLAPAELVARLPNLPPAMPDPKSTVRWTVIMVPASSPAAAPAPAVPGQPAAPVAPPVMVRRDIAYWSGKFKLDTAALTKEYTECFAKANLPLNAMNAEFVRVELLREEQTAPNVWSKPIVIANLPIHELMEYPADKKPAPATNELKKQAWYNYKIWLEQNQDVISHPAFYQTAPDAEPWVAPGGDAPAAVAQPAPAVPERQFDPTRDTPRNDAERAQADAYKAQLQAQRDRALRGRGGTVLPGPGGSPPGAYMPPGLSRRGTPNPFVNPGGPSYIPPTAPPNNNNVPAPFINPVGGQNGFNPGLVPGNAEVLVHDATIQEGKTYRYAVRYKLFNPMFDRPALAVAQVAAKFDIDSPDPSDPKALANAVPPIVADTLWTAPVTVEPTAYIFVQNIQPSGNWAKFFVYNWKDGHWHKTPVEKAMPGDPVAAGKESTPWTIVDVRKDPHSNEAYVLVMDNKGVITRHDVAQDQGNPKWQELEAQAGGGGAAAAAAR